MNELETAKKVLFDRLAKEIKADALGSLSFITAMQRQTDDHLKAAVTQAALTASWNEVAVALGVSKQAAHQKFNKYTKAVTTEMSAAHRTMKEAQRRGDVRGAAAAKTQRDGLKNQLRKAAAELKDSSRRS